MFRRRLNPGAPIQSGIKMTAGESACCGDEAVGCKYALTIAAETIEGIVYTDHNGVSQTALLETPTLNTSIPAAVKQITAALIAAGFTQDDNHPHINMFLNAEEAPDTVTLEIFASFPITAIKHVGQAADAVTETCVEAVVCRYEYELDTELDADVDLVIDDTILEDPQTIANLDTSGGGASATLVAISAAFETALEALYGDDYKRVKTKYIAATQKHKVHFWLYSRGHKPTAALEAEPAVAITLCECKRDYVAA